jgi:hypothetical protein
MVRRSTSLLRHTLPAKSVPEPDSAVVYLVTHYRLRKFTMETLPLYTEAHNLLTRSVSTQAPLEIKSMEISTVMTKRGETTEEELEIIEMRYQQALALSNLEWLFAEGMLNC